MINNIKLCILILIFSSCEPEESPIDITGIITFNQVDLGEKYCYQKYYDLEHNIIIMYIRYKIRIGQIEERQLNPLTTAGSRSC